MKYEDIIPPYEWSAACGRADDEASPSPHPGPGRPPLCESLKSTFVDIFARIAGRYRAAFISRSSAGDQRLSESRRLPDLALLPCARFVRSREPKPSARTSAEDAKGESLGEMGAIWLFCVARLESVPPRPNGSPSAFVGARQMYNAFASWAIANGIQPCTETAFGARMSKQGFAKKRAAEGIRYLHVRLKSNP